MARSRLFARSLPPPPSPTPGPPPAPRPATGSPVEALLAEVIAQRLRGDTLDPYSLPVVVACRGLIADTLGQLPLITVRGRRPLPRQPSLTVRPNPREYRWLSFHRIANNLTRWGHVWLQVTDTDAAGNPMAVRVIDAGDGAPSWDPVTGELDTVWIHGQEHVPGLDVIWIPYTVESRAHPGDPPLAGCQA